jgi:hypothetical protein
MNGKKFAEWGNASEYHSVSAADEPVENVESRGKRRGESSSK